MVSQEGHECEKQEGLCLKNTMSRAQFARVATNAVVVTVA